MIWPHEIAMRQTPGAAWQPTDKAEVQLFDAGMCVGCHRREAGKLGCVILEMAAVVEVNDPEYPVELKINAQGQPVCTAFACEGMLRREGSA